jgi:hypothetical protein
MGLAIAPPAARDGANNAIRAKTVPDTMPPPAGVSLAKSTLD